MRSEDKRMGGLRLSLGHFFSWFPADTSAFYLRSSLGLSVSFSLGPIFARSSHLPILLSSNLPLQTPFADLPAVLAACHWC